MKSKRSDLEWLAAELDGKRDVFIPSAIHAALIEEAIENLNARRWGDFELSDGKRKPRCLQIGSLCFLEADNWRASSPPIHTVIVLEVSKGRAFLPGVDNHDLHHIIEITKVVDLEKQVKLEEFCIQSYGFCFERCPPIQVASKIQAETLGIILQDGSILTGRSRQKQIKIDFENQDTGRSLWWQKWGGELFQFTIDESVVEKKVIASDIGRMSTLPIWRIR